MLPFLLNNLKDEIIAMDFTPEGESVFIRRRQMQWLYAFQQAVTHHQTHVFKSQEGKSNLDGYRQLSGYSWLQANDAMECTALYFHTIIYYGAWVKEHVVEMTSRSYIYFFKIV